MNRREFLSTAICAGGYAAFADMPRFVSAEKRLFRVGLLTDTHFVNTKKSSERAGDAWKLFRSLQADMVVHLGDICDRNWPYGYSGFRERIEEIWPSGDPTHPREVYVYAWHDYYYFNGDKDRNTPQWQEACALARERLKAPNGLYESFDFKGYSFVVVPQWVDFDRYERMLKEADARHPGRPFFVCDHIPPFDTVYNSRIWGDRKRLELLRKFPNAIVLSGHVHQSLRIETSIWQGDFTVVNAGCLATWGGNLVGTAPKRKPCHHVAVMDVYPSRIEILRYDVRKGEEVCPDDRWVVPLPFDAKNAPYSRAYRQKTCPVAKFPAGAELAVRPTMPFRGFELEFPEATGRGSFEYRLELTRRSSSGKWIKYARQDIFSEFHLEPFERTGRGRHAFPAGYFTPGETVGFMVTPVNFFGRCGTPLVAKAKVPESSGESDAELIWESRKPMEECEAYPGLKGGERLKAGTDGYYRHESNELRLMLPRGIWDGPENARFRFTIDLRMIQTGDSQWTLVLRNPDPLANANERIATPQGDSGLQRYVIEFAKVKPEFWYYFLVREGLPGRIRFEYVKVERLK